MLCVLFLNNPTVYCPLFLTNNSIQTLHCCKMLQNVLVTFEMSDFSFYLDNII